jgi:hypothetical protein
MMRASVAGIASDVADGNLPGINRRGTMRGFIYRMAVGIKEFGERHIISWLIRLGLWIRERV